MFIRICTSDNNSDDVNCRIIYLVFLNKIIKGAFVFVMSEFNIRYIKRNPTQLLRPFQNVGKRNKKEFSLRINKPLYKPGTGNAVDLRTFSCDPFHID